MGVLHGRHELVGHSTRDPPGIIRRPLLCSCQSKAALQHQPLSSRGLLYACVTLSVTLPDYNQEEQPELASWAVHTSASLQSQSATCPVAHPPTTI